MPKECTISKVITRSKSNFNPTIVDFQSGAPTEDDNEVRFAVKKTDKNKRVLLAAYRGDVNTIYRGNLNDSKSNELVGTYLAIRNKITNKVKLVEVDQCLVKSYHHFEKPEEVPGLEIDARSLLLKRFGSKSAARSMEKYEKTKYNPDIVDPKLNETVGTVTKIDDKNLEDEVNEIVASTKKSTKYSGVKKKVLKMQRLK